MLLSCPHLRVWGTESILCHLQILLHLVCVTDKLYLIAIVLYEVANLYVVTVQTRPMVPQKDLAVYGYGSVAWKDRMEVWKNRQVEKLQVFKNVGGIDGNGDGDGFIVDELDNPELPM